MNTFPYELHAPSREGFRDEPSDEAMLIGSYASGYPLLNKQFTFAPRTFEFEKRHVSQATKETYMAFYKANKDVAFYWTNEQEGVQHEIAFARKPRCRIDGDKDEWRISFEFIQTTPS